MVREDGERYRDTSMWGNSGYLVERRDMSVLSIAGLVEGKWEESARLWWRERIYPASAQLLELWENGVSIRQLFGNNSEENTMNIEAWKYRNDASGGEDGYWVYTEVTENRSTPRILTYPHRILLWPDLVSETWDFFTVLCRMCWLDQCMVEKRSGCWWCSGWSWACTALGKKKRGSWKLEYKGRSIPGMLVGPIVILSLYIIP